MKNRLRLLSLLLAPSVGCQSPTITSIELAAQTTQSVGSGPGHTADSVGGTGSVNGGTGSTGGPEEPPVSTTRPLSRFAQGLWRGEDPRIGFHQGWYYQLGYIGHDLVLFKHRSLLDRGTPKLLPSDTKGPFPYFLPYYIASLGGQNYSAWFAIDGGVWRADGSDPYDNIDSWRRISGLSLAAWAIDFELFQNPQAGPHQNRWYLMWAGAASQGDPLPTDYGYSISIYIAEVLSLDPPRLSTLDSGPFNRIISFTPGDWSAPIVEAPGVVSRGEQVSVIYTGFGALSSRYALGLAMLKPGQDPASPSSWVDLNHGGCDGERKVEPEMRSQGTAFGPGVGRVVPSPDQSESWLAYRTKVFDTGPTFDVHNLQMVRAFNLKKIGWRNVTCEGQTYTIPALSPPNSLGDMQSVPAGDPGPQASAHTAEAETLLPFGEGLGPSIQNIPRIGDDPDVITLVDQSFSHASKISRLDKLAADVAGSPKRAGLTWSNAPGGSQLTVSAASVAPTTLLLLVDGKQRQTLTLPASNGPKETTFDVAIAAGAQVQFVYEVGTSSPVDLDYFTLSGEPPSK